MSNLSYKVVCVLSVLYLAILSAYLLWHRMWFSPDQFFAAALVAALILGRFRQFLQDWISPIALFLGYESLRDFVPKLTTQAHALPMIKFDELFFGGTVPTVTLQKLLFAGNHFQWYDYLATLLYETHFVFFLLVGFILWLSRKEIFKEYYLGILILSYMAFVTYLLFPTVPPWMAAQQGFIPPILNIASKVSVNFPQAMSLPTIYSFFGANLVAAVPSLHAAYPFLTLLFLTNRFRAWGLLLLPYVAGVWFSIIYLGEHYFFDIAAGVLYAFIAFYLVIKRQQIWARLPLPAFLAGERKSPSRRREVKN